MKSNKIFSCSILFLGLLLLVLLIDQTYSSERIQDDFAATAKNTSGIINTSNPDEAADHKIIVYYFHGKSRCITCKRIERFTIEAVKEAFEEELKAGTVQTKVINVEENGNSHFTKDYNLITKSVIVSDREGDKEKRWKNLEKVWEYVLDERKFKEYIINEVRGYL